MRQSLSEKTAGRTTAWTATGLSAVLAVAGIVDQAGSRSLIEHATSAYASYGKQPSAGLLYGLVYGIAITNVLLWLLVAAVHRRGVAILAALISAGLAAVLLAVSEYGVRIFPTVWGLLALLPVVAGLIAVPALLRRRR